MKKREVLFAIVLGSMLAITGCGDDPVDEGGGGGSAGTAGTGGSAGSGGSSGGGDAATACAALCGSCGPSTSECQSQCEEGFADGNSGLDFESCGNELNALGSCVDGANSCLSYIIECGAEYSAWISCVAGIEI